MTQKTDEINEPSLPLDRRDFVSAVATGLDIIRMFDRDNPRMRLSEVATLKGISRAKARRYLLTLQGLGYVRERDRYFELTPRTLDLGYTCLSANDYQTVIQQHLEHITEVTGESSSMGVLDGTDVIHVACSAARHQLITIGLNVGSRLPAVATAIGRTLLATIAPEERDELLTQIELVAYTKYTITDNEALRECLSNVRLRGYCIADQELELGLRSLAVPVRDQYGKLLGALNMSVNAARVPRDKLEKQFLPLLIETRHQIEHSVC